MPIARKTKSGKYNCKVVDHYEYHEGKRKIVFRSFTAASKTECERLAAEFQDNKAQYAETNITVDEALDRYITAKENVLSPYTVQCYRSYKANAYGPIQNKKIKSLRDEDIQRWMNEYKLTHSPKTCRNANGLLVAAISIQKPNIKFRVTLPQKCPPELYTPTDEDIKRLLDYIKGTELEKAVLLAAFGTLRRGEVCAVTYDDIHGDEIRINKELIRIPGRGWSVKAPKTTESIRTVKYPHQVIERLLRDRGEAERIVDMSPDLVTRQHKRALAACGLPEFRFHDLRAYAVSIRHAIGIPDVYIMQDGGYKTDTVMKQIYRRSMSDKRKEFSDMASEHFSALLNG